MSNTFNKPKVSKASETPKAALKVEAESETKVEAKPFKVPSLSEQLALQRKIRSNR